MAERNSSLSELVSSDAWPLRETEEEADGDTEPALSAGGWGCGVEESAGMTGFVKEGVPSEVIIAITVRLKRVVNKLGSPNLNKVKDRARTARDSPTFESID